MSSLLEQLKKKPVPKKREVFAINIKEHDDADVEVPIEVNVKIIDETDKEFDRDEFLKKLQSKLIIAPKFKIAPKEISKAPKKIKEPSKVKKTKRKMRLTLPEHTKRLSKKISKGTITGTTIERPMFRKTRKPDLSIIREGPIESLKITDTILKDRLPVKEGAIIRAPSYYMNNREIFINFINALFMDYRDELVKEAGKVSCESRKTNKGFVPLTHQKIVRDYLNLYTPYRGLLLYHGLGSGKTCSSIAIAEGMKSDKEVIIMTPASLRANYIGQLKFCGDLIYKKDQYWERIDVDENPQFITPISKVLQLEERYIEEKGEVWMVNVTKESNFETLSTDEKESLNDQLNVMIRNKYKFINYNGLRKSHIKVLTKDGTINPFDNKVIIIDEAHNFISRIVNKLNRKGAMILDLYNYFLTAENCRIVLLTGTPIINYPNELGIMFNILRGYIKTFHFPLAISSTRKTDTALFRKIFEKTAYFDYLEYVPSKNTLIVTRNPFGFVNRINKSKEYKGIRVNERGQITDEKFIKQITSKLTKSGFKILPLGVKVEFTKALPDTLDEFRNLFITPDGLLNNEMLLKRRIIGLASYFKDIEELMPQYDEELNFREIKIPMSDPQFAIYEMARQAERKQEKNARKKRKKQKGQDDIYKDAVSTYRIFSRLFCNFIFPSEIPRPMPRDDQTVEEAIKGVVNETAIDTNIVPKKGEIASTSLSPDDVEELVEELKEKQDTSYDARIKRALQQLKIDGDKYLTKEALETYSPKFLHILENIEDIDHKGLHLIYSQFRTIEGIGVFKLILEQNGFTEFKIKKVGSKWMLNMEESELGKPTFALYTGTEDPEMKEITRNIFNSDWKHVPSTIKTQLERISGNNYRGEIIKVLMITAAGAEGVNLKNVRYVHLMEPYWHPVRLEQVIGRARRICSHENLDADEQNIEVFLYLMELSDKQKESDSSRELRKHDTSKLDRTALITSDEALHEISTIKRNINKQLLKTIKESSIDCALHMKSSSKEPLKCFTFGDTGVNALSFKPEYSMEERDDVADINREIITWEGKKFTLGGKKYVLRLNDDGLKTDKVYDYDSYIAAKETGTSNPLFIGKLVITGKKAKIVTDS